MYSPISSASRWRRMRSRTLPSCPERTWTTYHWFSGDGTGIRGRGKGGPGKLGKGGTQWPSFVMKFSISTQMKSQSDTEPASRIVAIKTTTVESVSSLYFLNPLIFGSDSQGQL